MEAITLRELLEAVGGTLIGPAAGLEQTVSHVDTDSRNIHPGSLFIPLVGERFDGHAYINSALEGGAAGCLTQRERESYREDRFYIKVKDTQRALRDLAAWYKDRFPIPFVGVTGSVGKTTAKDMIAAVLGVKYKVLKTEGNFNNNIGLPLTLLRLDRTYQMGVLEMGMDKFGEIDYLGDIVRPEVGVITNIGDAHIEKLGSRENIRAAKLELCEGMPENAPLVLNADDPWLASAALPAHVRPVWVGIDSPAAAIRAENIRPQADSISFTIRDEANGCFETTIPAIGRHNIYNALSAYAAGVSAGLDPAGAAAALQNYRTTGMRQHVVKRRGVTVMEDCYNASPDSMRAAFSTLAQLPARRRCALVGDMLELGAVSKQAHAEVGRLAAETGVEVLVCYGPQSRLSAEEARRAGVAQVVWCQTPAEAVGALHRLVQSGDALLAKASRGMKLEDILAGFYRLGE